MSEDTFKITYFKGNGRAVLMRAVLSYAKAKWENNFVDFSTTWQELKASGYAEFGQVPILEHNGKTYSQSAAITLYLARHFNIYGKNIEEEYQIDSLLCAIEDFVPVFYPVVMPLTEEQKNNPAKFKQALKDKLQQYFKVFEARYAKFGSGKYFFGDHFSLADIFVGAQIPAYLVAFKDEDIMTPVAPNLKKLMDSLKENELKEFFEKYFIE